MGRGKKESMCIHLLRLDSLSSLAKEAGAIRYGMLNVAWEPVFRRSRGKKEGSEVTRKG